MAASAHLAQTSSASDTSFSPRLRLDLNSGHSTLRSLNDTHGMTFVFATHDPKVMERARRIVRMEDGRIVSDERR